MEPLSKKKQLEFEFGPKIGSGSFAEIFIGINKETKRKYAIKRENTTDKPSLLHSESNCMRVLRGGTGIPVSYYPRMAKDDKLLVMSLHGSNLEDLFSSCNKEFSLKTVLMLADQMIDRVEFIHSKGMVHQNIRPDNFLMGLKRHKNLVYLIDFGLARKYRTPTLSHVPSKRNATQPRMLTYSSINTHSGNRQSRRDDLESLGYVLMYFLRGSLPWQDLNAESVEQLREKITFKKLSTNIEDLCEGYPSEFASYFQYCRSLCFKDEPDYAYLKRMFSDLFIREGFQMDYVFDWTSQPVLDTILKKFEVSSKL